MAGPDINPTPQSAEAVLTERKRRIFSVKTLVLLVLSVAIAYFLIGKLDLGRSWDIIRNANLLLIAASCLVYFTSNFFKALRFRVMLSGAGIPFLDLYSITSYHNFFNQIMPARTGELTFVYYLKKIGNIDVSKGLHILVVTRIFDFIVISAFFICSIILFFGANTSIALVVLGVVFLAVSVITLFNLKWLVIWSGRLFHAATARLGIQERPLAAKILGKIDVVVDEFSSFKAGRLAPMLALTSMLTWGALYFLFYLTIRSFGIEIGFIQSVAGSTGGVLTNVLPINSFGSFGTLEAGWTGGFLLVGMSEHDAIFTGFGYHVISFFASALIALVCAIAMKIRK
ncbi:MAG: flippase-like domain-containing protein [Spirochaetes bacterium]|nr:flippase-like domain-containing protein [Spirochaetota bacterium]